MILKQLRPPGAIHENASEVNGQLLYDIKVSLLDTDPSLPDYLECICCRMFTTDMLRSQFPSSLHYGGMFPKALPSAAMSSSGMRWKFSTSLSHYWVIIQSPSIFYY
ncbi:hypothetical protein BDR07DRAFT_690903 [Suillus spraguei]|nr:hypothetical protein BDR07DRAFT_690903 [Suillus spraguei]